jgi:hypothetical protein
MTTSILAIIGWVIVSGHSSLKTDEDKKPRKLGVFTEY